ncbi:MAG: histidine kinase dimerization/phospho-acceptor domain-containing protein, partial [Longimicrobiales bacterium]|nr:histidine kinase dimerization/phospho-acceptor domain-containing protein [Longimicrobiales bacterium]
MTVRSRLIASFAVITAILLIPALYSASRLSELRSIAVEGRDEHATAVLAVGRVAVALADLDRLERSFVATGDDVLQAAVWEEFATLRSVTRELDAAGYAEEVRPLTPVLASLEAFGRTIDTRMDDGDVNQATDVFRAMEPLFDEARRELAVVASAIDGRAQADFERARQISVSGRTTTLLATGGFLVLALALGVWTTRALTRPLRLLVRATSGVAEWSFRSPDDLPYERADEIGELSRSFRTMTSRLADLSRMQSEFVGVASHELKTPINVIHGYAELLDEEIDGEMPERQKEILKGIVEQTDVLSRQVSRLMDISKLETGSYRTEMEPVHLEDLITGLVRSFEMLAAQAGVALETEVLDSAPERIVMDADLIRDEVLGNLVANAIKYSGVDGTVRIVARGEADGVLFLVSDTGPGIPEKDRSRIFEKYYQVERSRTMGSGLG